MNEGNTMVGALPNSPFSNPLSRCSIYLMNFWQIKIEVNFKTLMSYNRDKLQDFQPLEYDILDSGLIS